MNKQAINALKESVQLYRERMEEPTKDYEFAETCPLCAIYNNGSMRINQMCQGCPIVEDTSLLLCGGNTPFLKIADTYPAERTPEMFEAEADYLESLLPPEER